MQEGLRSGLSCFTFPTKSTNNLQKFSISKISCDKNPLLAGLQALVSHNAYIAYIYGETSTHLELLLLLTLPLTPHRHRIRYKSIATNKCDTIAKPRLCL